MKIFAIIIVVCAIAFYYLIKASMLAQLVDYMKRIVIVLEKGEKKGDTDV